MTRTLRRRLFSRMSHVFNPVSPQATIVLQIDWVSRIRLNCLANAPCESMDIALRPRKPAQIVVFGIDRSALFCPQNLKEPKWLPVKRDKLWPTPKPLIGNYLYGQMADKAFPDNGGFLLHGER